MKASKFTLIPLALTALMSGCAVYGPAPVAYEPAPVYAQPVYVTPQPVYVRPPVSVGFSYHYRSGPGWRYRH